MIGAVVEVPYSGAWVADTTDTVDATGTFNLTDGRTWSGTVASRAKDGGRYHARIVGGKGKLGATLADKWYNGTLLSDTVAEDAISEAGETLGASAIGQRIDSWQRKEGTLGQALAQLAATTGSVWWVGRDGTVNLAASRTGDTIQAATVSVISTDVDGSVLLNVLPGAPELRPGDTWNGVVVRHVRWTLTPGNLTAALAFYDLPTPELTLDYLRTYDARVDSQNDDGTVNVIVDQRFSVASVKWLSGLPAKVTINPGDQLTLCWLGGDPQYPVCMGVPQTAGTKAASGIGDTVDCGTFIFPTSSLPSVCAIGAPIVFLPPVYVPPGPGHDAAVASAMTSYSVQVPTKIDVAGLITSGLARVKW